MASPGRSSSGGVSRDDGRLAHQPGDLQCLADHSAQLLQVERLEQVVVGPLPHRLDGRIGRPGQGDEDDRDAGVDGADLFQDLQAGLVGQAQVEENDVGRRGRDALEALRTRIGDLDSVCGGREDVAHLLREQPRVVVDEQQVGRGAFPTREVMQHVTLIFGYAFWSKMGGLEELVR